MSGDPMSGWRQVEAAELAGIMSPKRHVRITKANIDCAEQLLIHDVTCAVLALYRNDFIDAKDRYWWQFFCGDLSEEMTHGPDKTEPPFGWANTIIRGMLGEAQPA